MSVDGANPTLVKLYRAADEGRERIGMHERTLRAVINRLVRGCILAQQLADALRNEGSPDTLVHAAEDIGWTFQSWLDGARQGWRSCEETRTVIHELVTPSP